MIRAAGKMGWRESEFWFSTPSYFFEALAGWMDQERDRTNTGFAQARLVAYYAGIQYLKSGTGMADIWPLPWDEAKENKFEEIDPEEIKRFEEATARAEKQLGIQNGQWAKTKP